MTTVAFHLQVPDKFAYACRLLRKAVAKGARLVVTADAPTLARLNQDLWTFSGVDFVPHCHDSAPDRVVRRSPVVLAESPKASGQTMTLINLGHQIPTGFDGFGQVIEVIPMEDEDLRLARERWKYYAKAGYKPVMHDIGSKTV